MAQMSAPQAPGYQEDPQKVGVHADDQQHHEKKSIVKKVKEKAKKIKSTLGKKQHGHGDQDNTRDRDLNNNELNREPSPDYDEDDEEDEAAQDPEVHGAPMYDQAGAKNYVSGVHGGKGEQPKGILEREPAVREDPLAPNERPGDVTKADFWTDVNDPAKKPVDDQRRDDIGNTGFLGTTRGLDKSVPDQRTDDTGKTGLLGTTRGFEADPHGPSDKLGAANYQAKTPDSIGVGGSEAAVAPIITSFDRMTVGDEPKKREPAPKSDEILNTGSHDQFSPERTPANTPNISETDSTPRTIPESFNPPPHESQLPASAQSESPVMETQTNQPSSYTDKLSYAATALTGTALSAKDTIASKLGYGGNSSENENRSETKTDTPVTDTPMTGAESPVDQFGSPKPNQPSSYTEKLSLATSALTSRAASAKDMVASKLGYGGNQSPTNQSPAADSPITTLGGVDSTTTTEPQPGYGQDTLMTDTPMTGTGSPVDQSESPKPNQPSSYTEKLSLATSALTSRAASAKDMVASKLGYGGNQSPAAGSPITTPGGVDSTTSTEPQPGYGQKVTSTVSETLVPVKERIAPVITPVYDKVTGVGTTLMSKVKGTGQEAEAQVGQEGADKGVTTKGYLSEKLSPGEEDRALSQVITDTLYRRKGEGEKGTVTESDEVKRDLGSAEERSGEEVGAGKGVVDMVKGTVGSWFSKGGEAQGSPTAVHQSQVKEDIPPATPGRLDEDIVGERKLQESSN